MENKMVDLVNEVYGDVLQILDVTEATDGFSFYTENKLEGMSDLVKNKTEEAWLKLIDSGYGHKFVSPTEGSTKHVAGIVIFKPINSK